MKKILLKLSILRTYFIRGHSNWFAYVISLVNFVTISFYLLIENLTIVPPSLKFRHYLILFALIYAPLAIIVGFVDMKKGTYRVEQNMAKNLSPLWNDVFTRLERLDKQQKEILKLLKS
ncbi:MAG: hypothetical protein INQ03_20865 [Candidatus Heimdallarchaeota archaeon]|nr:hypothetical protein [Candidatus Heimdallarchaeota archaeon]